MRLIREATTADLPEILAVERSAGRPGDAALWLPHALDDPQRIVLVAIGDGRLVGWAKTHRFLGAEGSAPAGHYLGGLTVRPEARRAGVATALTSARCAWIAEREGSVHCIISVTNDASLALHRGLGFIEVARARSFHGTLFDAGDGILLTRSLAPRTRKTQQPS